MGRSKSAFEHEARRWHRWLRLGLFLSTLPLYAEQTANQADFFRSIGKMYVVIAVVLITFLGIVAFLVYMERRLNRLEKQVKDK